MEALVINNVVLGNRVILAMVLTALACIALIKLLKPVAIAINLTDKPGGRKQHEGAIPLVGGIGITLAFFVGTAVLSPLLPSVTPMLTAMGLLMFVGILDDRHDLSFRAKFFAQTIAALFMTSWAGIYVDHLGNLLGLGGIGLALWAIPFSVICVLGVINAINMLDGLDGLAGLMSLSALFWFVVAAITSGASSDVYLILMLASAICGFLAFNLRHPLRSRASVFMGDAGSMVIGLFIVWYSVKLSQAPSASISPIVAVWIIALPLLDMGAVMFRRIMLGRSPFHADREHLHHILLHIGISPAKVVWIMAGISFTLGGIGMGARLLHLPDSYLFFAFLALFALYYYLLTHAWKTSKLLRKLIR